MLKAIACQPCRDQLRVPSRSCGTANRGTRHSFRVHASQTNGDEESIATRVSRRLLLSSGAATGATALAAPTSAALVILEDEQGKEFAAYELPFVLRVVALQGTVPSQLIQDFNSQYKKYAGLNVGFRNTLQDIYSELSQGPEAASKAAGPGNKQVTAANADLVSLGDQWLGPCIRRGLLRPFADARLYRYWDALSPTWQALVQRDGKGAVKVGAPVWGVPYRWGCTLIAFRKDKFREHGLKPIQDWQDLLQPRLTGRVAFMESSRDFVGAAMKSLGLGYNTTAAAMARHGVTEDMLRERAAAFRAQVRVFSDSQHLSALHGGDVWAAVGSSLDVMQMAARSANTLVVAPASGTSLWADLWVQPVHMRELDVSPLIPLWVEQFLYPGRETSRLGLQLGFRPHQLADPSELGFERSGTGSADPAQGPNALRPMSQLDSSLLAKSEFLLPLSDDMNAMYSRVLSSLAPSGQAL